MVYYNDTKKKQSPTNFNLNDPVIKSYSKNYVDLLIETIIESINTYPRKYLFINSKNEKYTEKGSQKMLYDLLTEKNIGIKSLRSSCILYWIPKLNANQVQRVAFLMRTSGDIMYKNYLKKDEEEIKPITPIPKQLQQETKKEIKKLTPEQKQKYKKNRLEYNKKYYSNKKDS